MDVPSISTVDLGGPISYRLWDGPPECTFVLIHGLGGAHVNWVRVAPGLAGAGRAVAFDLPGFGWSPLAGRPAGLMDLRRVVSRVIEKLGSGRTILVGSSMGGAIAVLQAAVEPESTAGLVLVGSVFPWVRGGLPHPAVVGAFAMYDTTLVGERIVAARMRRLGPERAVRLGFRMVTATPGALPPEVIDLHVEAARRRVLDPEAPTAFIEAARSMLRLGRRPEIARGALDALRAPVLVLHGRRDRFVPASFAEAELRQHPEWRGRILPGVGHAPMLEAPARWLSEVADWLASAHPRMA